MKEQIIEKIRNAGVVGAGGAGFPAHVKVNASVDTVLVNGASCEPLLMSDPWLMEHETTEMLCGLKAVLDATGACRGVVCLKGKHKEAMAAVKKAVANSGDVRLECFDLRDFYPAGDEQVLVKEVLNRIVPEGGIPLQAGAVVSNVESLVNMAGALKDKPVTERWVTVTGEVKQPMLVKVPVGTLVADLIAFAGGPAISDYRVVDGGPMMGKVLEMNGQPSMEPSVTKTTSGLLVLPASHTVVAAKVADAAKLRRITQSICCQCTRCTDLCPRHLLGHSLHPHKLMRVWAGLDRQSPVAQEALLCSECGICEKFACPMMISPREVNAQIKKALMKEGMRWDGKGRELKEHPFRSTRYIPTKRLMQRLDVLKYDMHFHEAFEYKPCRVKLLLKQHIGAPSVCLVAAGQRVEKGQLVGEIPEKALGARVHASVCGVVEAADSNAVIIKADN